MLTTCLERQPPHRHSPAAEAPRDLAGGEQSFWGRFFSCLPKKAASLNRQRPGEGTVPYERCAKAPGSWPVPGCWEAKREASLLCSVPPHPSAAQRLHRAQIPAGCCMVARNPDSWTSSEVPTREKNLLASMQRADWRRRRSEERGPRLEHPTQPELKGFWKEDAHTPQHTPARIDHAFRHPLNKAKPTEGPCLQRRAGRERRQSPAG